MNIPVSIVILTKNEEQNLPRCLNSLGWCDDIHLVDSGSKDKTLEIAQKAKVKCLVHDFDSFGKQRNWALNNCSFKYDWILFLDADEEGTSKFCNALSEALASADDSIAGFYCCSKTIFNDKWLKYSAFFPKFQFRLLRFGRANFTDYGHGQKESKINGEIGYIKEPYLHYPISKGWSDWWERHNKYSDLEAIERLRAMIRNGDMFSQNGSLRNKALKPLVSRIPGWPLMYFFINYFFRLGFLDGRAGFIYSANMAFYEFLIQVKMHEIKQRKF